MAVQEFNMGYLPKSGVRYPFQKLWLDTTLPGVAAAFGAQVHGLQVNGTGLNLTRKVAVNPNVVPVTGAGVRAILRMVTATGTIVRLNVEHYDTSKNPYDLFAAISAHLTDKDGNAVTNLVETTYEKVLYV